MQGRGIGRQGVHARVCDIEKEYGMKEGGEGTEVANGEVMKRGGQYRQESGERTKVFLQIALNRSFIREVTYEISFFYQVQNPVFQ